MDILVVFRDAPTLLQKNEIKQVSKDLSDIHATIVREVGIAYTHTHEVAEDIYGYGCYIKHLCVCIF